MVFNPLALRWKIGALVALASGTVALVIVLMVHQTSSARIHSQAKGRVVEELDKTIKGLRDGTGTRADLDDPAELPAGLRRRAAAGEQVFWYDAGRRNGPAMWGATAYRGETIALWINMSAETRELRALDRDLLLAVAAALAVVVPVSALFTELFSRRLRRVARTARLIAAGDLDLRVGTARRARDEITEISAAVDSMAAALRGRLRTEQRFTADVAHELRTPLMGLVTAAELLPDGEAAGFVRDRAQVLRALVEDLLEISRLDAGAEEAERVRVPLGPFLEDCVRRTGLAVRIGVTGDPVAETDPRRLDRIVANLVVNAHRHGAGPVELTATASTITVRDHGPGFPPNLLAEGPQRFRTGAADPSRDPSRGHGLGLTIAQGQARVIGARLEFGDAPGGGAVAVVSLGP
ncbi:sensor histidine kinase [Actinomadura roseirufa]|uniref:sensor histidine kinase n=1 Tax=Actinomadura roseirufa TaxID=2094049 RepID=UPI0010414B67|nr:HAMP domain-containing sensor histidine kinase [Actinomadura roseirufa]